MGSKLVAVWNAAKKIARPFDAQIVKDEPAISAAVVGIGGWLGLQLGFSLTTNESATLGALVLLAVGAFTRQSVTPTDPTSAAATDGELVQDDAIYPPSAAMLPPDEDPIPEGG
jgi:hypothetical protein